MSSVTLVDVESLRFESLSSLAHAHFEAALAKRCAYRNLSRYYELQRGLDQRIAVGGPI